jgi:hypothetical protein
VVFSNRGVTDSPLLPATAKEKRVEGVPEHKWFLLIEVYYPAAVSHAFVDAESTDARTSPAQLAQAIADQSPADRKDHSPCASAAARCADNSADAFRFREGRMALSAAVLSANVARIRMRGAETSIAFAGEPPTCRCI